MYRRIRPRQFTQLLKRRLMPPQSAQSQCMTIRRSSSSDLSLPSSTTGAAEQTSRPPAPLLMIEGDRFELSAEGISRTAYALNHPDAGGRLVEELYNIKEATKTFILRSDANQHRAVHDSGSSRSSPTTPSIDLGSAYRTIELRELDAARLDAVGTGAMSWESSIAMSLYFGSNPHLLSGRILELGSGCGHGGILVLSQLHDHATGAGADWPLVGGNHCHSRQRLRGGFIESFVFTDHQGEILAQCERNFQSALSQGSISPQVRLQTRMLDWNCFSTDDDEEIISSHSDDLPQFTTILASDCAYRLCDIEPLSETIVRLLASSAARPEDATFHTFGPINRGALYGLIDALRIKGMEVGVETLEMRRVRLLPSRSTRSGGSRVGLERTAGQASAGIAKILHITARRRQQRHIIDDGSDDASSDDMNALD